MTLGKVPNLSEPQFLNIGNRLNDYFYAGLLIWISNNTGEAPSTVPGTQPAPNIQY